MKTFLFLSFMILFNFFDDVRCYFRRIKKYVFAAFSGGVYLAIATLIFFWLKSDVTVLSLAAFYLALVGLFSICHFVVWLLNEFTYDYGPPRNFWGSFTSLGDSFLIWPGELISGLLGIIFIALLLIGVGLTSFAVTLKPEKTN